MERPTITINGNEIVMPEIKARVWREFMQFEVIPKDLKSADSIEKHCAFIAMAFGVSTDDVLDNLDIKDVFPTYYSVIRYVFALITEKLPKKNTEDQPQS